MMQDRRTPFSLYSLSYLLLLLGLALAGPARAQEPFEGDVLLHHIEVSPFQLDIEEICVLHPGPDVETRVLPRMRLRGRNVQQTADIVVSYEGFDGAEGQKAKEAFARAVAIWETHISSPVTIKVDASFAALGENVLGSAGPNLLWIGTTDEGVESIYPHALIDALVGENVVVAENEEDGDGDGVLDDYPDDAPDIVARFSSEADWYYGTGEPGPGEFDFTSVVLHELAHGLGFFGSMSVTNVDQDDAEEGLWPFSEANLDLGVPAIYDRFAEEGRGSLAASLVDTTVYPNPSEKLGDALRGDNLFFEGIRTLSGNSGVPAQLYAPEGWNQGSSYSHVDEDVYPAGDENALMTPLIGPGEHIHRPGAIVCGMFADMGWPLGPGCKALISGDLIAFDAQPLTEGTVEIVVVLQEDSDKDRIVVEQQYFEEPFVPVDSISVNDLGACEDTPEGTSCRVALQDVGLGEYTYRLVLENLEEPRDSYATFARSLTVRLEGFTAQVQEETPSGNRDVVVRWTVPGGTEGFDYVIERCTGTAEICSEGAFEHIHRVDGQPEKTQYEATTFLTGPGNFVYRLVMEDEQRPSDYFLVSDATNPNVNGVVAIPLEGVYDLSPVYPNPAAASAQVDLTVATDQQVTLEVYNTLGQRVHTEDRFVQAQQRTRFSLGRWTLAGGVYIVRVTGEAFSATRKLVIVR